MEKHHAKAPSSRLRRPCHHRPRLRRRIAVVYFTKTGNTKSLAEAVRHMTGAALFRVETVEPYPESYGSATEIVKDELQRGVIRPIRPLAFNPDDYDVVVLATPTWWHHAAMPLQVRRPQRQEDPHRQHPRGRRPHAHPRGLRGAARRPQARHAPHGLRGRAPAGRKGPENGCL